MNKTITIVEVVNFLNEALELDRECISELFLDHKVKCNRSMADHETIQVLRFSEEVFNLGVLGLLQGLFGIRADGMGYLAMHVKDGKIQKFMLQGDEQ